MASADDSSPDDTGVDAREEIDYDDVLALEIEYEDLNQYLEEDPERVFDEKVKTALASAYKDEELWSRFEGTWLTNGGPELESAGYNSYVGMISSLSDEMEETEEGRQERIVQPPEVPEPETEVTWSQVDDQLRTLFDGKSAELAEFFATVPTRLLFEGVSDCPTGVAKGNSSTSKTTVLEMFDSIPRASTHDTVSPKAFVSHYDGDNGEAHDLLPKLPERSMLVPEMNTWFRSDRIEEFAPILSRVLDGNGLVRSTGTKGTTGYEADFPGEYQFGVMGATTPVSKETWVTLANVGSRFIFHQMPRTDSIDDIMEKLVSDNYSENVSDMQYMVEQWYRTFYHKHGGEIYERPDISDEARESIVLMAELLARGRSVDYGGDDSDTMSDLAEEPTRVAAMFQRMAQARAMLYGNDEVGERDLGMVARTVFASMPRWRVPMAKMLVHPNTQKKWTSGEIEDEFGVTRNTALDRMREMGRIGLGNVQEEKAKGGKRTTMSLADSRLRAIFRKETDDTMLVPWPDDDSDNIRKS